MTKTPRRTLLKDDCFKVHKGQGIYFKTGSGKVMYVTSHTVPMVHCQARSVLSSYRWLDIKRYDGEGEQMNKIKLNDIIYNLKVGETWLLISIEHDTHIIKHTSSKPFDMDQANAIIQNRRGTQ